MITRRGLLGAAAISAATLVSSKGRAEMQGSARDNGFFLPEESDPHLRTFMQWPSSRAVHSDPVFLRMLQDSIAEIANTVSAFEPVVVLMDSSQQKAARPRLSADVDIWPIATDDLWCRDSGPVFVTDGKGGLAVTQLNFNGWGNKQVHVNDAKVAERVAARLGLQVFENPVVGELGGLEADGEGTLIAHESSWVNPNRNAASRQEVEEDLLGALGAEKIIWAPGIAGADITDYHIDSLARFVGPGMVLIQLPQTLDPDDPWSVSAFETYDILRSATDAHGRRLKVAVIPEPERTRVSSEDFVASYVNYYVCNGAVIAAQFGDTETDSEARRILGQFYPDREIVMLDIDPIGETGGGIHCATQQQPLV